MIVSNIRHNSTLGISWNKKSTVGYGILFLTVALLTLFPFVTHSRFYIRLINEMLIYGLLAMSLDILLGYTGMLSFVHNAYFGTSAYIVGLFLKYVAPSSLGTCFFSGIILTSLVALPVGWIQVRTGGFAFALLTLAFGMMFFTTAWKWYSLTGGDDGLMGIPHPDITIGGWVLGNPGDYVVMYVFSLIIVLICFLLTWRILHSPFGSVLEAIRENEKRAFCIGINVRKYKLLSWMFACTLAGVSGALFILYKGYMAPNLMGAFAGGALMMMVLLGGMGTLWGPFAGAGIFIFMKDYISTMTEHWEIFVGLSVVLLVLFLPRGFAGLSDYLTQFRERSSYIS